MIVPISEPRGPPAIPPIAEPKIDTKEYFDFDDKAVVERIHERNPLAKVFFVSAKTGEGFEEWISWLDNNIKEWIGGTV